MWFYSNNHWLTRSSCPWMSQGIHPLLNVAIIQQSKTQSQVHVWKWIYRRLLNDKFVKVMSHTHRLYLLFKFGLYPIILNLSFVDCWQFGGAAAWKDKDSVERRSSASEGAPCLLPEVGRKLSHLDPFKDQEGASWAKRWPTGKQQHWPFFSRAVGVQRVLRWRPLQGRVALLSGVVF